MNLNYQQLLDAAQRWKLNGGLSDSGRPGPPTHHMEGRSNPGGTPAKDAPQHMNAVPKAPGLSSRTKPGTVPPRLRPRR